MSLASVIHDIIDEELLNMSTAFIGKILSFDKNKKTANVQPLTMTKAYGKDAKKSAILVNVPVTHTAQFKLIPPANMAGKISCENVSLEYIKAGDLCVCVVSDRDITEARKGISAVPPIGHHDIHNAIVVGVL